MEFLSEPAGVKASTFALPLSAPMNEPPARSACRRRWSSCLSIRRIVVLKGRAWPSAAIRLRVAQAPAARQSRFARSLARPQASRRAGLLSRARPASNARHRQCSDRREFLFERLDENSRCLCSTRAAHEGATLADHYDPDVMPEDLRKAHRALDERSTGSIARSLSRATGKGWSIFSACPKSSPRRCPPPPIPSVAGKREGPAAPLRQAVTLTATISHELISPHEVVLERMRVLILAIN